MDTVARTLDLHVEAPATFVVTRVAGRIYCLDVAQVTEVVDDIDITEVPGAPGALCGVTNVRGRVLALTDLAVALGDEPVDRERGTALVVDALTSEDMAILVDEVIDVVALPESALQPPPPLGRGKAGVSATAVVELQTGLAVVLDLEVVLDGIQESATAGVPTAQGLAV